MKQTFPAQPSSLCEIRSAVRETAERHHLDANHLQDLLLAVSEAGSNVILHTASPTIEVSARAILDTFSVTIHDQGVFQWGIRTTHGFGMPLMESLADSISVRAGTPERPGTTVELTKRLPSWQERSDRAAAIVRRNYSVINRVKSVVARAREVARRDAEVWLPPDSDAWWSPGPTASKMGRPAI